MALEFTTTAKARESRPVTVDWVGHEVAVNQPKDATIQLARGAAAESATPAERIGSVLSFVQSTLSEPEWAVFRHRMVDRSDPLNARAAIEFRDRLLERWAHWNPDDPDNGHLTIPEQPSELPELEPIDISVDGVAITCYPPKDLLLSQCYAMMSDPYDAVRAIGLFLDGCLDREWRLHIEDRLRDQGDDFGLEELNDIIEYLMGEWYEPVASPNRQQRRAAGKKKTGTKKS